MNRVETIKRIMNSHPKSFFVFSNGLTSREACHFLYSEQSLYLIHAMGEALSVGFGLASALPDKEFIVIEGDGSSQMGLASWNNKNLDNLKYYVLINNKHQTTGGQMINEFKVKPDWIDFIKIEDSSHETPNPMNPVLNAKLFMKKLNNG